MLPKIDPYATKLQSRINVFLLILTIIIFAIVLRTSAHGAISQYYWKDNSTNGNWDWSNNQWFSSASNSLVGAPDYTGGAQLFFEDLGNTTTTITNAGSGGGAPSGWIALNAIFTQNASSGKVYTINSGAGVNGIYLYNKIETLNVGTAAGLTINSAIQLGGSAEINAVAADISLSDLNVNSQTLNSYGNKNLNIAGVISGTGSYDIKDQGLTVTYSGSGANTFTGATTVENSSTLVLNKAADTAAIAGFLTINSGATARTDNVNQLNDQFVTVNGTLNLNGNAQSTALSGSGTVKLDGAASSGTLTINNTLTDMFSGTITDNSRTDGLVVKTGTGTEIFSNANTYDAGTSVTGGTLLVINTTGSGTGTSSVTVTNAGSVLAGGTTNGVGGISGAVNINASATLSPGTSGNGTTTTAILHTGALTLVSASNFSLNLNSTTAGTGYDQVSVTGTVNVSGSNIVVTVGGSLSIGDKFFVTLNDGTDLVTGTFAQGATVTSGADTFLINYLDNGDGGTLGNDISLTLTSVPEPSTWAAAALAIGAIAFSQRRRFARLLPSLSR